LLTRMRAKALVMEDGYGADVHQVGAGTLGTLEELASFIRLPPRRKSSPPPFDGVASAARSAAPVGLADHVVYVAFTSGTTGEPKGVLHSNNTLLANARSIAADWAFDTHSVIYTLSPLSHNLGFGALVLSLLVGGEIVLHDLPRGSSLLARLKECGATFIFGVPAHAMDLLSEIEAEGGAGLDTLKGFRISGAAAPSVVVERLLAQGIVPQSGYGMTEACSHHYTLPTDGPDRVVHTSGRACPGYEVAIFSADNPDVRLAAGEIGQIGGRGASLMLGYFGDQIATERSFNRAGWFMTGDLGCLDEQGYLQITGRIKDIIIRGGHNIHPAKIEELTLRHASVERAAAIPVKDERLGEKVCLVVMPKRGRSTDPDDLLKHLNAEGLSRYDMPEFFVEVAEIPLSANGKMLKRLLVPRVVSGELRLRPVRFAD
jgi:acyl-CoA synthetase (AMP-forming)/AMP-acid ligase II